MAQSTWTEEQIKQASEMWAAGASAQQIANVINKSRNAVIGKMNRLNVKRQTDEDAAINSPDRPSDDSTSADDHHASTKGPDAGMISAPNNATKSQEVLDAEAHNEQINMKRLPLMYLSSRTCRWPIGDPSTKHFWFCGKQSVIDKPYCSEHSELAYQNSPKSGAPESSSPTK